MQETVTRLEREIAGRYYGKYRGIVVKNDDPKKLARLMVQVPSVLCDKAVGWALPCLPFGGRKGHGWLAVPEVGAQVWVEFEEGNLSSPIWSGTFWQQGDDVPEEAPAKPTTLLLKTPGGHRLQLDDEKDKERFVLHHRAGTDLEIDKDGSVRLTSSDGQKILLLADVKEGSLTIGDTTGNQVVMGADGITLKDTHNNRIVLAADGITLSSPKQVLLEGKLMLAGEGGEPLLKGKSFLDIFAAHVHPSAMGPTGPPQPKVPDPAVQSRQVTSA